MVAIDVIIGLIVMFIVSQPNVHAGQLTVEKTDIVDCLLPGKVKKLGTRRTYISKRRPLKASIHECEIRGGEYVLNDRANFETALSVWQTEASAGNPEAQFYMGEIYEKGMGRTPDYGLALLWYQRAADQDFGPARLALGLMYEKGLGVKKDLVQAMDWYRKATGMVPYESAYGSAFDELKEEVAAHKRKLQEFRTATSQTLGKMSTNITEADKALAKFKRSVENQKALVRSLEEKLDLPKNNLEPGSEPTSPQSTTSDKANGSLLTQEKAKILGKELAEKQQDLKRKEAERALLEAELKASKAEYETVKSELDAAKAQKKLNIAVRWPKLEPFGTELIKGIVSAGTEVNLVGAIFPLQELKSFTINGKNGELDQHGLFLHHLAVGNRPLTVTIKAIDVNLEETLYDFTLFPVIDNNFVRVETSVDETNLPVPKVDFGNYHALIIGNNHYQPGGWPNLETAITDAQVLSDVLETQYGFNVTLMLDASRDATLLSFEKMRGELTQKDNLLIYYAGHGHIDPENDQGYWIPVDGALDSSVNWVSNAAVTDQVRAMNARNVMIIADSCYSATLMRSGLVSLRSGLTPYKKMKRLMDDVRTITRTVLSSGGIQPVADSLPGSSHSVFADALINILKTNNELLDGEALAIQVGSKVAVETSKELKQVPRYAPLAKGGHQGGEFYFVPNQVQADDL